MHFKKIQCCGLFLLAAFIVHAQELPLTNPEAPSAKKETKQTSEEKTFFDGAGKRFCFGSKTVQVMPSGYIQILNSGRKIGYFYFYGDTLYSSYFTNNISSVSAKIPYSCTKKYFGVNSFTVDEKNQSITVKGKVPYHKDKTPEILGDYSISARMPADGKIVIRLEYTRPKTVAKGSLNMFCAVPQAAGYTSNGKDQSFPAKKWAEVGRRKPILIKGTQKDDSFAVRFMSRGFCGATPEKSLFFGNSKDKADPEKFFIELELDLEIKNF